jgi:hypothetical protein
MKRTATSCLRPGQLERLPPGPEQVNPSNTLGFLALGFIDFRWRARYACIGYRAQTKRWFENPEETDPLDSFLLEYSVAPSVLPTPPTAS